MSGDPYIGPTEKPDKPSIEVMYRNYRGEYGRRVIIPMATWYGESSYHEGEQWFMRVWDLDKDAYRDFALGDMDFGDAQP